MLQTFKLFETKQYFIIQRLFGWLWMIATRVSACAGVSAIFAPLVMSSYFLEAIFFGQLAVYLGPRKMMSYKLISRLLSMADILT